MQISVNDTCYYLVKILEELAELNNASFALWNIGTSIETIVNNFINNIKLTLSVDKENINKQITIDIANDNYAIYIGKIKVTPVSDNNYYRKASTVRQYLQVLYGCGIIDICRGNDNAEHLQMRYKLSDSYIWLNSEESILMHFKKKLITNVFRDNKEAEKLVYSLIVTYLYDNSELSKLVDSQGIIIRTARGKLQKQNAEQIIGTKNKTLYNRFYDSLVYYFNEDINAIYSFLKLILFIKSNK